MEIEPLEEFIEHVQWVWYYPKHHDGGVGM